MTCAPGCEDCDSEVPGCETQTGTDPLHCGGCGTACELPGMICAGGSCTCGEKTSCPSGCADLNSDPENCGACGNKCELAGSVWIDGDCTCAEGSVRPTGCVDLQSDPDNCGACGAHCETGMVCTEGSCTWASPFVLQLPPSVGNHLCFLGSDKKVSCWGANNRYQTGYALHTNDVMQPTEVLTFPAGTLPAQVAVSINGTFSCATLTDGRAMCWGYQGNRRLGNGVSALHSVAEPHFVLDRATGLALQNVARVVPGDRSACALLKGADQGRVKCWGSNNYSELGEGLFGASNSRPWADWVLDASGNGALEGVERLYGGGGQFFAQMQDGTVVAWGHGQYGKLGLGNTSNQKLPVVHAAFAKDSEREREDGFLFPQQGEGPSSPCPRRKRRGQGGLSLR